MIDPYRAVAQILRIVTDPDAEAKLRRREEIIRESVERAAPKAQPEKGQ